MPEFIVHMKIAPRHAACSKVLAYGACVLASITLLGSCSMTPEDKAFYGRGWINPDELDQDQTPPRSFNTPTSIEPGPLPPAPDQ